MTDYETLNLSVVDGIGRIEFCRPDLLNRFDEIQHHELAQVMEHIRREPDVRVIVLSAQGKAFSAGGDFDFMRRVHDDPSLIAEHAADGRRIVDCFLDAPTPVIAAMHGPAVGLGATVVLLCDAVVASRGARIVDPHVLVGLAAGDGGCLVWPQAIGMLRAKRYLLTGDPVLAEDGFEMGIVTDLVDTPDEVLPAAMTLAGRIAGLAPLAVQGTKQALNNVMRQRAGEVLELSQMHLIRSGGSDDLLESLNAREEKRMPKYTGR